MKRIYLVRHGQDEDNAQGILNGRRDMPLTNKGIEQAHESAQKIKDTSIQFDEIYSSPLRRAYQTACIITDTLERNPPTVLQELTERELGVASGQLIATIDKQFSPDILKTETISYILNPDGGETFPQLVQRADRLLASLDQKHPDETILLVTHGDFGKMIYAAYYHLDWQDVLKQFHFGNSELLELSEESGPESAHVFTIEQHNV